ALLGAYAYAAWDWRGHAFAGFLPTRELAVSHDEPFSNDEWPALAAGLAPGDRILSVGGVTLEGLPVGERVAAFNREMAAREPDQRVLVRFTPGEETGPAGEACLAAVDGASCAITIALASLSPVDF